MHLRHNPGPHPATSSHNVRLPHHPNDVVVTPPMPRQALEQAAERANLFAVPVGVVVAPAADLLDEVR